MEKEKEKEKSESSCSCSNYPSLIRIKIREEVIRNIIILTEIFVAL